MPKLIRLGRKKYPLGNAYCLVPIGKTNLVYREYCTSFPKDVMVYIDEEKTDKFRNYVPSGKTGRYLLQRFYDLKLAPLVFKWKKAKTPLETNHWICAYPCHYVVTVEQSSKGIHADDHLASLFYRGSIDIVLIAQQQYEGHLRGNEKYNQPSILQAELREWRINQLWFQDAITRDSSFDV